MSIIYATELNFLAAFAALFAVSNPIGCVLIFAQITENLDRRDRADLARRIAFNSGIVLIVALWAGGLILAFLGIGFDLLRIAGGLVVAVQAWRMIGGGANEDITVSTAEAFIPLTIPMTTGPGTIAVAITLGSGKQSLLEGAPYFLAVTLAAVAVASSIALLYGSAHRIIRLLGEARARVFMRLSAFLLLCIGVQILVEGIHGIFR